MGTIIKFFWNSGAAIFWGLLIFGSPFWLFVGIIFFGGLALFLYKMAGVQ